MRYRLQKDAFSDDDFAKIRAGVLDSKWVGQNPLDGTFSKTRGFGVVFRKDGQAELKARLPYVGAFLEKAIAIYDDKSWSDKIAALLKAASVQPQEVNAFYLNVLIVEKGAEIAPHFDTTLRDAAKDAHAMPRFVSVLYVNVPFDKGGELSLYESGAKVCVIEPCENTLVSFRGDLVHGVSAFESSVSGDCCERVSLVLEAYALDESALGHLPKMRVQSRQGFAAHLRTPGA